MRIAYAEIRDLSPSELEQLSADERERQFASVERQRQFRCGRWLLRTMLAAEGGRAAASYRLVAGDKGKPVCEDGPALSISHAGRHVACCIADRGEVGVDLEVVDLRRHAPKVARRFFAAAEADWLETQPKDRFFMLWVLKEAYVKALGCGIFGGLNGLQCIIEPPHIRVLDSALARLSLALFELRGAYLAVASTEDLPDELAVAFRDAAGTVLAADPGAVLVART
ncbi:MAG TPA: 4'-phosphopantetheinyl transferase superfamily protein [Woeseiaceae bacterium]|nr:4'-phosphopantetheinyl transferase superfamily protein [Woeseiaceae bacterium]